MANRPISLALISVSDKTGLIEFATKLHARGVEILSTGGTAKQLAEHNIPCRQVSDYTGFPEMMNGRVKTLHPKICGGILARLGQDDAQMEEHAISPIDLVVCNLYPFEQTIAKDDCTEQDAIENIDIGGPCMIRAAGKCFQRVNVVVQPSDYDALIAQMDENERATSPEFRRTLAQKAFAHTSQYDTAITTYLAETPDEDSACESELTLSLTKIQTLRYGENPHQTAGLYAPSHGKIEPGTLAGARLKQGKPLSYNNLSDANAALTCVKLFEEPACVIVKHANPCGVAIASDTLNAYQRAYQTDPTSSFGGIIAVNREFDEALANAILEQQFVEVILAPCFTDAALACFAKKPNVRLLELGTLKTTDKPDLSYLAIDGGMLVQEADHVTITLENTTCSTERSPTEQEQIDMIFAWKVAAITKSNAIVLAKDGATVGIGAGQMSRIDSTKIALRKAEEAGLSTDGCALASDAFFPFPDNIELAAEHGICCVIQPGGSIKDAKVKDAANQLDIAMLLTGTRHFRH